MKMTRVAKAFRAGLPWRSCLFATALLSLPCPGRAAISDAVPEDKVDSPALSVLTPENGRKVEAMAKYMAGLLDEEAAGPEKAFESYRRVLDLDPGFSELAIYVAHEHLRRGDSPQAISVLKDALKANPKDGMLCLALSSIYLRQLQKPDLALKYAQLAQELKPEDIVTYEALCAIYESQGQKARVKQTLERAAKSSSASPQFWLKLGELTWRASTRENRSYTPEDLQRVTLLFEKALEYADGDLAVMASVVELYIVSKQIDRAIPICERILKSDPDFPRMQESIAVCYGSSGKTDEALAAYDKVVEKDSLNLGAYDAIAELSIQKEDYARALESLRQAMVIDPYEGERYLTAGRIALKYLRKPEDAIQIFSNARIRFSTVPEFTLEWAVALSLAKRHQEAMRAFEQTIFEASSIRPGLLNAEFYNAYGTAAVDACLYARAEEMLRKAIDLDPEHADTAYNGLGYMWAERGENLDEAEEMIKKALGMEPTNGAYLDSLGWVYYKKNKFPEALAELLRAAEHLPAPDPVVYEHIGDTYQKLNQPTEAVLYWQKASALDPENKALLAKIDANAKKVADRP